jgi:hypothetical protein
MSLYYIVAALLSAIAYGSDVIFGKFALDDMPFFIFMFILAFIYFLIALFMFIFNYNYIIDYFYKIKNYSSLYWSIIAIILGTIIADILMWKAIQLSNYSELSTTITLIHMAPVFGLIFIAVVYKYYLNYKALFGFFLVIVGLIIMIFNSNKALLILK